MQFRNKNRKYQFLFGYFSTQVLFQHGFHPAVVVAPAHEAEQFAQRGFGGDVAPGKYAGLLERGSGGVEVHVYRARFALGDVQENLSAVVCFPDDIQAPGL